MIKTFGEYCGLECEWFSFEWITMSSKGTWCAKYQRIPRIDRTANQVKRCAECLKVNQ